MTIPGVSKRNPKRAPRKEKKGKGCLKPSPPQNHNLLNNYHGPGTILSTFMFYSVLWNELCTCPPQNSY